MANRTHSKKTSHPTSEPKPRELAPEQKEALNRLADVDFLLSPFWAWRSTAGHWRASGSHFFTPNNNATLIFSRVSAVKIVLWAMPVLMAGVVASSFAVELSFQEQVRSDFKAGHPTEAVALLQKEAATGNPDAQYGLGILYEKGLPEAQIPQNSTEAFHWYSAAADKGHAPSQNNLGFLYYTGQGTPRDYAQALHWYEKSAAQNDPMAEYNLGTLYYRGLGVTKDFKKARALYLQAAQQGNVTAQNNLGFIYEHGLGVTRDFREAVRWYKLAAKNGHGYAQRNLAEMYEHGLGAHKDYSQALSWYKKAAAKGHAHAQMKLGLLFENGWGTSKDPVEAYAWYSVAMAGGNTKAKDAVARLDHQLSPAQISDAKERASHFSIEKEQ